MSGLGQKLFFKTKLSIIITLVMVICSMWVDEVHAQGGNTCAIAATNNLNFPFTINNFTTCNRGNDYIAGNSCLGAQYYSGQDWYFAFNPTQSGFATISITSMSYPSGSFACIPSLTIFQGCPTAGGTCLGSAFGNWSGTMPISVTVQVQANTQYYILLDSYFLQNFYAGCFTFNLTGSLTTIPVQPSCTNMGFDSNNFNGWTATKGLAATSPAGSPTPTYSMNGIGVVNGRHTIVTGGNDPCGGFPRVAPAGNGFSVRLGNNQTGAEAEQLRQTFMVSPSNASFTYKYAVVFEDAGHPTNQQPFFKALLRDQNGTMIQCSEFIVAAQAGLPGFINSTSCAGVRYKPWSTVNVDLTSYVGQSVTVEFTTGDCSQGGHFGYAYIDAACSPSTIAENIDTVCVGQSVTLQAPTGYSNYVWNPGNVNQQNYTVTPLVTSNYILSATAFNGCVRTFNVPITVSPLPTAQFQYTAPTCNAPVVFSNSSQANSNIPIVSYNWNFGAGAQPATSNAQNPSVNFPNQGTYNVSLTVTNAAGCSNTISQTVMVPPCAFGIQITGATICAGQCFTIVANAYNNAGAVNYQWSLSGGNGNSLQVCPTQNTLVTLNATDSQGNTATDTAWVNIAPTTSITSILNHPSCFNANNGSFQIQATGLSPFTYALNGAPSSSNPTGLTAGTYQIQVTNALGCVASSSVTLVNPAAITANTSVQNALCNQNNGTITIQNVSGGTAPYSYSLNNGAFQSNNTFSNLAPGNFTIRVRDANLCEITLNAAVGSGILSQIQFQKTDATCNNANGTINLSGFENSLMPYSITINNGNPILVNSSTYVFDQLIGGNYSINITDVNACVVNLNVVINQLIGPQSVVLTNDPATCGLNNASVMLSQIQGGTAPYSITFNNMSVNANQLIGNLAPGIQCQFQVIDSNQCVFDSVISTFSLPDLAIQTQWIQNPSCYGGNNGSASAQIMSGSAPFVFTWSNGETTQIATQLGAGIHTVSVVDQNGCNRTAQVILADPLPITAQVQHVDATCGLNNAFLSITQTQGGQSPYQYMLNSGVFQSDSNFSQLSAGNYSIQIRDANNCQITINDTIGFIPVAQIQHSKVDATCNFANGRIELSGFLNSGMPYQVSINGSANQMVNSDTLYFSNLIGNTYQIDVVDGNGCVINQTIQINQITGPQQIQFQSQVATCGLNNATLTINQVLGGTSPYVFAVGNNPATLNQILTGLSPNSNIQISVTDANNCLLDTNLQIGALPDLAIQTEWIQNPICYGDANGSATVNVMSGSAPFQYVWSNGEQTQTATQLFTGNHQIQVIDSIGCVKIATIEIFSPDSIFASVSIDDATCGDNNGQLIINPTTGNWAIYSYQINGNGWQNEPYFDNLSAGNYLYQVKNNVGCIFEDSVDLNMTAYATQISFQIQHATCSLSNGSIEISNVENAAFNGTLSLTGWPNANLSEAAWSNHQLPEGNYQLQFVDANLCVVDTAFSIANIAGPTDLMVSVMDARCGLNNGEIQILNTVGGTSAYQYNFNNTGWGTDTLLSNLAAGSYIVSVRDQNQCEYSEQVTVVALPEMQIQAQIIQPISCFNDSNAVARVNIVSGFAPYQIMWSNNQTNMVINSLGAGNYWVNVTDSLGCVKQSSIIIENPSPFSVAIQAPDSVCKGTSVALTAQASEQGSHIGYVWNIGYHPGQSLVMLVDSTVNCTVTATNLMGCADTDSATIHARELPTAIVRNSIPKGCAPVCTALSLEQQSSPLSQIYWFANQENIGQLINQPICFETGGNYSITGLIRDVYGCENSIQLSNPIEVYDKPMADFDFTPEQPNSMDNQVKFYNRSTSTYLSQWTFGQFGNSTLTDPLITFPDTGSYNNCLTVTTEHGCTNKICKALKIEPVESLYAPSAFSPNDDGVNDYFSLKGQFISSIRLEVYNRWGEMIYIGDGYNTGWDGTLNGRKAQNDVYVWKAHVVFTSKQTNSLTGMVQLVE